MARFPVILSFSQENIIGGQLLVSLTSLGPQIDVLNESISNFPYLLGRIHTANSLVLVLDSITQENQPLNIILNKAIEHCLKFPTFLLIICHKTNSIPFAMHRGNNTYKLRNLIHIKLNDYEAILDTLRQLYGLRIKNSSYISNYISGLGLQSALLFEQAISVFNKITIKNTRHELAWYNLSYSYYSLGRYEEAQTAIRTALNLNSTVAASWNHLGRIQQAMDQVDSAFVSFSKAIQCDSEFSYSWSNQSVIHTNRNDFEQALICINKSLSIDAFDPFSLGNKGYILFKLAQFEEALQTFESALLITPKDADLWANKAVVLEQLGRFDEGIYAETQAEQYK